MANSIITERVEMLFKNDKSKKQKQLAEKIGISASTLSTWLSEKRDIPPEYLLPICEFWNISLIWLLTGNDTPYSKENENITPITENEQELLLLFRELPNYSKERVIGYVKGSLETIKEKATD